MKRILRTAILSFVRLYGARRARKAHNKHTFSKDRPLRILLVRPDHLGDMVMVTPILEALKAYAPNAHITMMIGAWSHDIVARHPAVDRLLTCPFPGFQRAPQNALTPYKLLMLTARDLRQQKYDLAINLRPDFWWGAALLYLARIPHRIGYAIEPGKPFLTEALAFPTPEHATVSNLRLASAGLQALGYPALEEPYTPERYPLSFKPREDEHTWVAEQLMQEQIPPDAALVVIHPGTGGPVKLWRTEAWQHIIQQLQQGKLIPATCTQIVLTGSKHERPMLEKIAYGIDPQPVLLTDMSVGQLAALLSRADLVLGVDNGPLHLAAAQDTPSLRLFGPTDTRIFGPWGNTERHRVLASQQRCAGCPVIPCGRLDFRPDELDAHPCVRSLSEQLVAQTIQQLVTATFSTHNKKMRA